MKNILGIIASQRKLANGELLLKEAAAATEEEYHLDLIRLPDLKLEACRGCVGTGWLEGWEAIREGSVW